MWNSFAVRTQATDNTVKPLLCDHQRSMPNLIKEKTKWSYYRDFSQQNDQGPKNWSQ